MPQINLPGSAADQASAYNNMPTMPDFQGILNPDGTLQSKYAITGAPAIQYNSNLPQFQNQLNAIQLNKQPLNQLEQFASSTEDSPWAKLLKQQQTMQQQNQMDSAGRQENAATGTAYSNLGVHGGATSGARERIATDAARNLMTGRQGIQSQGAQAQLGIGAQDAQNKLQTLQGLPAAEIAALQPELQKTGMWGQLANSENNAQIGLAENNRAYDTGVQEFNTGNSLKGLDALNQYNLSKYGTQMQGWAANQTANAQQNSGKK